MSEFREKLKSMIGGATRRTVVSACVMIAVSLVMIFTALFAPFRYFSDKDVLHIVYTETEDGGEAVVTVNETRQIRQSLFKVFEAAVLIDSATTLHAASQGEIYDREKYDRARERLAELRAEYSDIINRTKTEARENGIAEGGDEYAELLADNLSGMNLMALDMLETAFASDNSDSYGAVYRGVMFGLVECLINLLIIVAAITAIVFALFRLVTKSRNLQYSIFFTLFTALSASGLLMCVFNPLIPPVACPLALACVAVAAFFASGLLRTLLGDAPRSGLIKNAVVAAGASVAMLCLAAMPSLTAYVNGMGGQYLFYPGTVGTVYYSRIEAMIKIGLGIPEGAITVSVSLGIIVSVLSVFAATTALYRFYNGANKKDGMFNVLLTLIAIVALALIIAVSAISADLQADGTKVKYIVGASWYVNAALMLATAVFSWVIGAVKRKTPPAQTETEEATESETPDVDAEPSANVTEESTAAEA